MPRQLPWVNKNGRNRTKGKQPPAKKQRISSSIDDSFFDGTVFAGGWKGSGRADDSDDDLPDLPAERSTPRTKSKTRDALLQSRAESSSPPPIADLEQPQVEKMRKGVSKFDLHDDEWMMVEDELLETAKLFTRHLHIAEYEKLKETIEEKKREAETPRSVVAGARMSIGGAMKQRAEALERRQKTAIRDFFGSPNKDEDLDMASSRSRHMASTPSKRPPPLHATNDSESDDLDAPRPVKTAPRTRQPTSPLASHHTATAIATPRLPSSNPTNTTRQRSPTTKSRPPFSAAKPRVSKQSRATPFDMLDDYTPHQARSTPKPTAEPAKSHIAQSPKRVMLPPSPIKPSISSFGSPTRSRTAQPTDSLDEWGTTGLSKETADRLAKRRAGREKGEKEKARLERKAVRSDEIPTFLF